MTRTKWLVSLSILGLLLLGAALFFLRKPPVAPEAASASAEAAKAPAATPAAVFQAAPPLKRVMELYEKESARVGQVDPDPKATEARLREAAKDLKPEEISWLEGQASDARTMMDARFFAVYLLGLSQQEASVGALSRIALSEVPPSKNERLFVENRALRASAVEGMCTPENCKQPLAREKLLEVVANQRDEWIRDRANRCLYACQYGKHVEDADKSALDQLRRKQN